MKCTHSRQVFTDGVWVCRDCTDITSDKRRRGMTEWEKTKLSFYRHEKNWIEHIRSREIVYDKQGKQHVIIPGRGEVPIQPREYWPKPKVRG